VEVCADYEGDFGLRGKRKRKRKVMMSWKVSMDGVIISYMAVCTQTVLVIRFGGVFVRCLGNYKRYTRDLLLLALNKRICRPVIEFLGLE
jgi:hypothetical protein